MTGEELNNIYGNIIMPDATVSVPAQWMPAVHEALQALHDLPGSVRAFLIVTGFGEENGHLVVEMVASTQYISADGMAAIASIVEKAQAAVLARRY